MTELLTTVGSSNAIEQLIKNSKEKLYLISPYMQINPLLRTQLEQLDNRFSMIDIRVVSRTDKINADDMAFLQRLKNVKIFALDNLHAKCYVNQDTAIITSLNLYQYSQQNNVEMGVKIDKATDVSLFEAIDIEVQSILRQSKKYEFTMVKKEVTNIPVKESVKKVQSQPIAKVGFCIRCGQEIGFNMDKPLCNTCYQSWAKYGDRSYPEKHCHICGKESKQSYEKPVCYSCYKKNLK